jgi:hypothetical protein
MGLEAATYIHQLNPSNPVGAVDPKAQGDDHLRLLKSTIQATFPNITGPVTATHTRLNMAGDFATPTVKVAATGAANAGVLTTSLRSDAKLLLDLADTYAWTGQHSWAVALRAPNGVAGTPSYSFASDPDTGIYLSGTNSIGFASNGARVCEVIPTQLALIDGSVGTPVVSFILDPDTGIYRGGADNLRIVTNGGLRVQFTNTFMESFHPIYCPDGAVGAPSITFGSDPDTGIYRISANTFALASNGVRIMQVTSNNVSIESNAIFYVSDGDASTPGIAFNSDGNTGFYRRGTDRAAFTEGGSGYDIGFRNVPQNSQSGNYGLVQTDSGKHILHPSGGGAGDTYTIPSNAAVPYDIGTVLTFVNRDSNSVSIAITTDTMILAGTGSTGTRALAQNGIATAMKVAATEWLISGTGLS